MSETFEYDVLISHSSKDKQAVRELAERLRDDGLRVWLDEWEIKPGDPISIKVERGLEQSRALILVMSANAFASEWVTLERHTVMFRDPTNAQRRFIPLQLDDAEIVDTLKQFAYVDWRGKSDQEYAKLLAGCRGSAVEDSEVAEEEETTSGKVLGEHTDVVWCVTVTPDGQFAISGSWDNTLKVWDLESGAEVRTLRGHTGRVVSVTVTPDGQFAISGSWDNTLKVWDLETGVEVRTLKGDTGSVWCVTVTPDGQFAISGSSDSTLKVWDLETGTEVRTLKGHTGWAIMSVTVTPGGQFAISGSSDSTLKVWDLETGAQVGTLKGHTDRVTSITVTPDGRFAISGSWGKTLKVWDLETGAEVRTLKGHTGVVLCVTVTPDGQFAISGSSDKTLKVWDLKSGYCTGRLEGHTGDVNGVALTPDGRLAVSGADDRTVRVWELTPTARYTNAKVVLVGETGVGKTGLALRLCEDRWEATESTHGMVVYPLKLPPGDGPAGMEREVWLWDFAGQPDYRLIHQLYMGETALGVLVFDPQDDNPFESLGYWEKALHAATKYEPARLLVAGRCDRGGITISERRFDQFVREHNFAGFLRTGARTGEGCEELKAAIARHIPWERLPWTMATRLFRTLKDAIVKLTMEDSPLVRLPEMLQRLQLMLPGETIGQEELRTVVGLMQGQGVVHKLDYGELVLLQPEQINRYASVVVRMAREHVDEMGTVPEQQVLDGRLDYKDMKRLSESDEKILLPAMTQTFLDRSLCLREDTPKGTMLVFPSYFRRDKLDLPEHPNVFITYGFAGPLDDIYATLVVRLSYSDGFQRDQLWKNAADFKTHGGKRVGLAMDPKGEGKAEIVVYFEAEVPDDTKVTFIKYVHEHLLDRAQDVTRVRTYVCPHCNEPLENRRAIQIRLGKGLKDILCTFCEERVPLIDLIEEKFASDEFLLRVRALDERARINLDNESRELILVGHAFAIAGEAGQIFRPTPNSDWGIDGEIEFKDREGNASGKRVYLQLKSGDSYLYTRQRDDREIFTIKKQRHADYWQKQPCPVMLVIRTSDGEIRWMNVTEYLKRRRKGTKQIEFDGEPFTAVNVMKLRDRLVEEKEN